MKLNMKVKHMKPALCLLLIAALVLSACQPVIPVEIASAEEAGVAEAQPAVDEVRKVLLIPRENSADLEFMLTHELAVMRSTLEDAGFEVVVATRSGKPLAAESMTVEPDMKLADVDVGDYAGIMLACMAAGIPGFAPREAIAIVQEAVAAGKPVAAQYGAISILGRAGVLEGKEYAYGYPEFPEGQYMGEGVIQDGNIITSGTCPMIASLSGDREDGTPELTLKLIESLE